jgi:hypothetical protein
MKPAKFFNIESPKCSSQLGLVIDHDYLYIAYLG